MIPLVFYLSLSTILFAIGSYGVLTKRNVVRVLMCIEIMMNAAALSMVAFSMYMPFSELSIASGQIFTLFILAIAAGEAGIGLGIYILVFRLYKTSDALEISNLRW
jgi:NADH:ubiquinone oxidoreductase subunit K